LFFLLLLLLLFPLLPPLVSLFSSRSGSFRWSSSVLLLFKTRLFSFLALLSLFLLFFFLFFFFLSSSSASLSRISLSLRRKLRALSFCFRFLHSSSLPPFFSFSLSFARTHSHSLTRRRNERKNEGRRERKGESCTDLVCVRPPSLSFAPSTHPEKEMGKLSPDTALFPFKSFLLPTHSVTALLHLLSSYSLRARFSRLSLHLFPDIISLLASLFLFPKRSRHAAIKISSTSFAMCIPAS